MKNLIDDIKKIIEDLKIEKQKCLEEIDYPLSQVDRLEGRILAYTDIVMCLTNYNLITAPKSIKLSEIVSKLANELKDEYEEEIYYNKDIKCIGFGEYKKGWFKSTWLTLVRFNKDFLIRDINLPLDFNFKWLYALWIAGTEIVNDLECDEDDC